MENGRTQTGLCLDIDGTLYRQGSVFVETVAALSVHSPLFGPQARASLREAVGIVGEFHGSRFTRWRYERTLRGLAVLRRRVGSAAAARAFDWLRAIRERVDGVSGDWERGADPAARAAFQQRLLERYARAIAGQDSTHVAEAVRSVLSGLQPIDRGTATALSWLGDRGVDLVLITDMPSHVAEAFAETVIDVPVASVAGTTFRTDESGAFTGDYATIDKGAVVEDLVDDREWAYTLAAGDTERDAAMAPHVDTFLAVAGHGGVRRATEELTGGETVCHVAQGAALGGVLIDRCPVARI